MTNAAVETLEYMENELSNVKNTVSKLEEVLSVFRTSFITAQTFTSNPSSTRNSRTIPDETDDTHTSTKQRSQRLNTKATQNDSHLLQQLNNHKTQKYYCDV